VAHCLTTEFVGSALPRLRLLMGGAVGVAFSGVGLSGVGTPGPAAAQSTPANPVELPPVAVEGTPNGYQATVPALPKLTEPLLDTPQSINVVPRQLLDDQGVSTVADALRNVPGISLGAGEAGNQGNNLTLRGFSARNDFYLDGMRDFGSYYRDSFNLQDIEVLKGPASVLFGRGSTGGVINQVSKRPQLAPITAGTMAAGTDGTYRFTADINRALEGVDNAAFRLNVMGNLNGVAERNNAEYRRFGVAPSLAFGIGTATRLNIDYFHLQEYNTPDYGLPWFYSSPAPVNRRNFYGFKDSDYLRTNVDIATVRFEHDFNDNITFRDQFRYASYGRSGRITEPQVIYAGITPTTPLNAIQVNRNIIAVDSTETFLQNQADVLARFQTGPVRHVVIAGVEAGRETSTPTRFNYLVVPRANLVNPDEDQPFTFRPPVTARTRVDTTSAMFAAYVTDTIKLGEQWELIGGFRWDVFDTTYSQTVAPVVNLSQTDSMPSYRAAVVYKPTPNGSIYFAYGTSFNPSAESLSLAVSNAGLAPEENRTFEIGTKWNVLDGRLTLNGSIFQIEKLNARVPDPLNTAFNILGGNQRVRGFEIGATGRITDRWEVYYGYSFINSKVTSSTLPNTVGNPLANTPQHTLSLWNSYVLPWYNIQVGAGIQYVSSRISSSTPDTTTGLIENAPGYVTFQAMAKYPVRPGLDLQVNVFNVTNTKYYDLLHPSHVVPGAGTSALFSAIFKL